MFHACLLASVQAGGYVALWKLIPLVIVVLIWAKLLTWADKDAVAAHMPREPIDLGLLFGMVIGVAAFFLLPQFFISLAALLVFFAIDIGVYLYLRNEKVGLKDLKGELRQAFSFGSKKKVVSEVEDLVQFMSGGGTLQASPGAEDPERPAFDSLQESLADPLRRGAEAIELVPSEAGSVVRYMVDGVGYRAKTLERANAAAVIALAKKYAGMDVKDRRKPQTGKTKVSVNGKRHELVISTAGSSAGESMRIQVDPKNRQNIKLDTLGFNEKQLEGVRSVIADGTGIVLVSTPKGQGLTSLLYGLVSGHDAFVEQIQMIERHPKQDLEGITQTAIPSSAPAGEEARLASWVTSQQPEVVVLSPITEQKAATSLIDYAKDKRAYIGMRTNGVTESLAAWRKLVGNDKQAISGLKAVIAGRVIRKLCPACKTAYNPDPATLRKMNMDPEKVTQLYQARAQPMRNEKGAVVPCTFCNELRYSGRMGVFEVLIVDDDVRSALLANSTSQLKAAFRKQKGKYLQETALEIVEKGETSVQEVLRVLRGPDQRVKAAQDQEAESEAL